MKALGREVKGFEDEVWTANREQIVYEGLKAKFRDDEELKEKLLSTGDAILAECAVHDKVWGIGLSMKDPNRFNVDKWRGLSLLGNLIMQVREELRDERL
nr:NADAR family protein [Proteiniclasticum sp.]